MLKLSRNRPVYEIVEAGHEIARYTERTGLDLGAVLFGFIQGRGGATREDICAFFKVSIVALELILFVTQRLYDEGEDGRIVVRQAS